MQSETPRPVLNLPATIDLASGEGHTCALHRGGGDISCWGLNLLGALGDGSTTDRRTPAPVLGL
jgi:alpha-tubulin suppressor-like RCC1 family protein